MTSTSPGDREIVQALRAIGLPVGSIDDLVNTPQPYPQAIPVLLKFLPTALDPSTKQALVRALTVREARGIAAEALIREFVDERDPESSLKWALGNALSVVTDDAFFEEVVKLVQDKRHGRGREMLVLALGNMKDPRTVDVLINSLSDEQLAGHAIAALGRLKAKAARAHILPFLDYPLAWVRREARRALAKIDKAK